MGFVVGPAIGGVLSPHGEVTPFWIAMGLALLNILLVLCFLPETRKQQDPEKTTHAGVSVLVSGWGKAIHNGPVVSLVLVTLLYTLAFTGMETVFPLLTQKFFGWKSLQNGYVFMYVGILIVLMQGGMVRPLVKRYGERNLMLFGLVFLGLGLLMFIWSSNLAVLLVAVGILSIGDGAVTPTSTAILSLIAPADEQGEILGFSQGIGGLGRTIGPLIAGALYTFGPGIPFLAGGGFALLAIVVTLPTMTRIQRAIQAQSESRVAQKEKAGLVEKQA